MLESPSTCWGEARCCLAFLLQLRADTCPSCRPAGVWGPHASCAQRSAAGLSWAPKQKACGARRAGRREVSFQAWVRVLLAMSSLSRNEQYLLKKTSLNRNAHKIRLFVDWLMKTLGWEARKEPNPAFPLGAMGVCWCRVPDKLVGHNYHE